VPGTRYRESFVEILDVFGCTDERRLPAISEQPFDVARSLDTAGRGSSQSTSSFGPEAGVWRGGPELAVRTVVAARSAPSIARAVARVLGASATWRADAGLVGPAVLGRTAFAQAEYYFNGALVGAPELDASSDPADGAEWLWHTGWRARLRPWRLAPELGGKDRGANAEQAHWLARLLSRRSGCALLAAGQAELCSQVLAALRRPDGRTRP
jgi:hypothetical protein